jgi:hypothetical protein
MSVLEQIEALSRADALEAMEALWQKITADGEPDSPGWHQTELQRRETMLESGEATFTDWKKAKERISERIR